MAAAPPTPAQLSEHVRFLTENRILAMVGDFQPRRDGRANSQTPLPPGRTTNVNVVDVTDPSGFLLEKGRRKINMADTGLSSLVGVDITINWTAHDAAGQLLTREDATPFGGTTLPSLAYMFKPRLVRQGVTRPPVERTIRARLKLTVDPPPVSVLADAVGGEIDRLDLPIDLTEASAQQKEELKKVDVGPVTKNVDLILDVPVEALPVPNLLLAFRHTNYALSHKGDPGFLLVMVPAGSGLPVDPNQALAAVQDSVNGLRQKAQSLVGLAGFLGENLVSAIGPVKAQLDSYRDKARFGVRVVVASSQSNLNNLTMIQNGRFTNDVEAEDEISALMTLGLPGSGWRLFADRNFKGSHLDIVAGSRFLTEAPALHNSAPVGTTNRSKQRKSWGDSFSSLDLFSSPESR